MILRQFLDRSDDGGFCELNENNKGKLIECDIIKLSFKKLYTYLILQFIDEGLLRHDTMSIVFDKLKTNVDNINELLKKDTVSEQENIVLNGHLYGHLYQEDYRASCRISGYMNLIMNYYYTKYYDNILYIDTDTIYMVKFEGEDFIKSIGVPYNIKMFNQIYFVSKKRFIKEEDGKILISGPLRGMKRYLDIIQNVELTMRSNVRERKLKEIGL